MNCTLSLLSKLITPKLITVFLLTQLLTSCTQLHPRPASTPDNLPQAKAHYTMRLSGADGTPLSITVYQPKLKPLQSAPVIIQLHAFAMSGASHPLSFSAQHLFSGKAAMALWKKGYWVISPDIRGHGKSGGLIHLAAPDKEVQDVTTVIDWVDQHLNRIKRNNAQQPIIGLMGDSYGAGIATLASIQDPRIQAVVAAAGWYDLQESLAPHQVVKLGWLKMPVLSGHFLRSGQLSPMMNRFYQESLMGRAPTPYNKALDRSSPRFYCDQDQRPQANMLILQGLHDSLFDYHQGKALAECVIEGGNKAHLMGIQEGHLHPFAPWRKQPAFYHIDDHIFCDEDYYNTQQMALDWFDAELKHLKHLPSIPQHCITQSRTQGKSQPLNLPLKHLPLNHRKMGTSFRIQTPNSALAFDVHSPMSSKAYSRWLTPKAIVSYIGKSWSGHHQPLMIPLTQTQTQIKKNTLLLGQASYHLTFTLAPEQYQKSQSAHQPVKIFFGLGVIKDQQLNILNNQLTPLLLTQPTQTYQGDSQLISQHFNKNQTLYWVAYAYKHRTPLKPKQWWENSITIEGSITLPLLKSL